MMELLATVISTLFSLGWIVLALALAIFTAWVVDIVKHAKRRATYRKPDDH